MKKPDDIIRLRHMLESAKEACEFMGDTSFEDFSNDRMLVLSIVRALEIIGEAAANVTQTTRDKYPEIEWEVIIGMRNRLIHAYFDINYKIVWQTIHENLPNFTTILESIVKGYKD
jgi:uncharacterized protein with HEPN domain